MKIKINISNCILVFGISSLILNTITRMSLFEITGFHISNVINYGDAINFIAIISILCILVIGKSLRFELFSTFLVVIYSILILTSNYINNNRTGIVVFIASILPGLILIIIKFKNVNFENIFRNFLKIYNFIIIFIFSIGVIDFFIGGVVNKFIAENMSIESWGNMIITENQVYGFRLATILGSPLMNAFYSLVFLVSNNVYYNEYKNKLLNKYFVFSFTIITISLTGSRSALFIALVYIICVELLGRKKFFEMIVMLIILAILFQTNLFQSTVYSRLQLGFMNSTDARYQIWGNFQNNSYGDYNIFIGKGYNYSRLLTTGSTAATSTSNFEYPILMFLFDNGLIATCLYYWLFAVQPSIIFLKKKNYELFFSYGALLVLLNTFNAIAQFYDFNLALAFIQMLFIGISYNNEGKYTAIYSKKIK